MGVIYYGDNLDVLREYIPDESVDLIYLDPPFNSRRSYKITSSGIHAFSDIWRWDGSTAAAYQEMVNNGGKVSQAMQALNMLLSTGDMLAYLVMMAPRLAELHRVLKSTGSIYLHCDPKASHYLKILMDVIFGAKRFTNEIVWGYHSGGASSRYFGRKHHTLFWYVKGDDHIFNDASIRLPYTESTIKAYNKTDQEGRRFKLIRYRDGREKRVYAKNLERGRLMTDVWEDVPHIANWSGEKTGYPMQKPRALLERLITVNSNEGDLVLDPFCGSGTTVAVAERLKRHWIGIDNSPVAIAFTRKYLVDMFGDGVEYQVVGLPDDLKLVV